MGKQLSPPLPGQASVLCTSSCGATRTAPPVMVGSPILWSGARVKPFGATGGPPAAKGSAASSRRSIVHHHHLAPPPLDHHHRTDHHRRTTATHRVADQRLRARAAAGPRLALARGARPSPSSGRRAAPGRGLDAAARHSGWAGAKGAGLARDPFLPEGRRFAQAPSTARWRQLAAQQA